MISTEPQQYPDERPSVARMYDYFLGGYHNFAIDREAAARVLTAEPDFAHFVRANREFLRRAVSFVVGSGVRQLLDLGSGIPTVGNVHEVAQARDPSTRVVYVDIDPIAYSLSREILEDNPNAVAVQADAMDPEVLLSLPDVQRMLDLRQPLAVLLVAFLHFVDDDKKASGLIGYLRDVLAPGSYLALTHATGVFNPERAANTQTVYNRATSAVTLRSREQIAAFLEGFELVEPGIVPTPAWRPDARDATFANEPERGQAFAAVGRKLD